MIREIYAAKRRGKKKGISVLKSKYLFRGASTAIITPFFDGKADFKSFARLIDRQLDGGRSKHRHAPARKGVFRKAQGSAFGKVIKNGLAQSKAEKTPLHHNAERCRSVFRDMPF